ncbi:hypothetical protein [Micromonospora sp. NPDC048898]|uniref:hypothetical protein n=1 Tax=Micromonospora sp. NPDC048898 TaxID=3364260 RepID=UPI00370FDBC4
MGYPVLLEKTLPPAPRRLLGRRRNVTDLPPLPPGAVYVFKVDGHQRLYGDRHIDYGDEIVVDAVAVSVVQRRTATLTSQLPIPSISAADEFTVVTTFRCQVLAPEVVAETGLTDLATVLTNHLWQDRELKNLGLDYRIDDINDVRRLVDARITAYCTLVPPSVPGMAIELTSVMAHPSTDLRDHGRKLRDKQWDQQLGRLDVAWQNEDVERVASFLSAGPTYADALGVSRNEINVGQVAERMHDAESLRRQQLNETLQEMVKRGFFDRVSIDPVRLMDEVVGLGAAAEPRSVPAADEPAQLPHRRRSVSQLGEDAEPDFIPNEADID